MVIEGWLQGGPETLRSIGQDRRGARPGQSERMFTLGWVAAARVVSGVRTTTADTSKASCLRDPQQTEKATPCGEPTPIFWGWVDS
jgi:hypothetical protein